MKVTQPPMVTNLLVQGESPRVETSYNFPIKLILPSWLITGTQDTGEEEEGEGEEGASTSKV